MKTNRMKYACTFNGEVGNYAVGDEHEESTVDYVGNDLEELIKEVWNDDPYFEKNNGYVERVNDNTPVVAVIGIQDKDDRYPTCIIYKQ